MKSLNNDSKAQSLKYGPSQRCFHEQALTSDRHQRAPPAHPAHFLLREAASSFDTLQIFVNDTWV